jgi:cytidine deaminase
MQTGDVMDWAALPGWHALLQEAVTAQAMAYAPFSRFPVGAAVATGEGRIFRGANYESASYGLTQCAERAALLAAQAAAAVPELVAIALAADDPEHRFLAPGEWVRPCGACRQWIFEASRRAGRDLTVLCLSSDRQRVWVSSAHALLPAAFA